MSIWLFIVNIICILLRGCDGYSLTYYTEMRLGYQSEITPSLAHDLIKDAFDVWACYTGIRFEKTNNLKSSNIVVIFGGNNHHGYDKHRNKVTCPIQELGTRSEYGMGVVAHSTSLFNSKMPGNIHVDESEVWVYHQRERATSRLLETLVHEIGHVFAITHDKVIHHPNAVMVPGLRKWVDPRHFDLTPADINALRTSRFGQQIKKLGLLPLGCSVKNWQRNYYARIHGTKPCKDQRSECRSFQAGNHYCEGQYGFTSKWCRKTCSFCKCEDTGAGCSPQLCITKGQENKAASECRRTCGYCPVFTAAWAMFRNTYFSTLPCRDEISSHLCAQSRDICRDYQRKIPAFKFCRKHCRFC